MSEPKAPTVSDTMMMLGSVSREAGVLAGEVGVEPFDAEELHLLVTQHLEHRKIVALETIAQSLHTLASSKAVDDIAARLQSVVATSGTHLGPRIAIQQVHS